MRESENRVLSKITGPKRKGHKLRKLHDEELHIRVLFTKYYFGYHVKGDSTEYVGQR